ncbi:hypothetical protein BDQ12DRAFT_328316 [Crucibulum laeve]|uniref:Glucose-methanol-choline oxidoreductase N-terminal domain-containing protein n=1 Tax=Crucibulum laeve TaxID=68775 RepID=A0A5C3LSN1_9AGAR|nr:hypothetical protein BDQ12DRAFT_328316 [Crucibulum laeve]
MGKLKLSLRRRWFYLQVLPNTYFSANFAHVREPGSFQSPQLLELSGIGDEEILKKYDISVMSLPSVGCKHGILTSTRHLVIYCPTLRNISFLNSFFCLTAKVYQLRSDRQQAFIGKNLQVNDQQK